VVGILLVALCLGRLKLDAAQLLVYFFDDVLEALQILVNVLELAQGFDFLALKRLMPAASSKMVRRSLVDACRRTSTRPCSMMP